MVDVKQSHRRHIRKRGLALLPLPVQAVLIALSGAACVDSAATSDGWLRRRTGSSDRGLIVNEKSANEILSNPLTLLTESGHKANISHYPFFAFWSDAYCGASLIAPDLLLTAAHCGSQMNPLDHKVVQMLTANRLEGGMNLTVVHQESHPNYNHELHVYDYQILKLDRSALINPDGNGTSGAQIVSLNTDFYHPHIGTNLTAVGFGSTTPEAVAASDFLMDVTMERFPHTRCDDQYGPKRIPDDLMLCMGVEGGGKDVCQGRPVAEAVCITPWHTLMHIAFTSLLR
jgi:secreted trypsin-like serine protease